MTRHAVLGALLALSTLVAPAPGWAAAGVPERWTKGFNYTAWWHDGYASADAEASLSRLAATGADSVALFPAWYMPDRAASALAPDSTRTPSDASLAVAVARAQAKGLSVMLRPAVDVLDGSSRQDLAPRDPERWFASYRKLVDHYADLGRRLGVDSLEIGLELESMTRPVHEAQWRSIIAGARERFKGTLTYGADAGEYEQITWWDALDVIGIDAYFQLSNGPTPSVEEIAGSWSRFTDREGRTHHYVDEIAAVQARYGKPVIFTELGYRSGTNALVDPWNTGGTYSAADQQRALEGAFRAFSDKPWFTGVYLWHWYAEDPDAGGAGDTDHTLQNKPAVQTVTDWYTRAPSRRDEDRSRLAPETLRALAARLVVLLGLD